MNCLHNLNGQNSTLVTIGKNPHGNTEWCITCGGTFFSEEKDRTFSLVEGAERFPEYLYEKRNSEVFLVRITCGLKFYDVIVDAESSGKAILFAVEDFDYPNHITNISAVEKYIIKPDKYN